MKMNCVVGVAVTAMLLFASASSVAEATLHLRGSGAASISEKELLSDTLQRRMLMDDGGGYGGGGGFSDGGSFNSGGYGGGGSGGDFLSSLGQIGQKLQISNDENMIGKQLGRGFQRLRATSTIQMRAGVDQRYFERTIRADLSGFSNIPSDYWNNIETQITGAFVSKKSNWENREFMFNIGKGCKRFAKKKMDKRQFKKYIKSLPKHQRKEAIKKWKNEKFWDRQCPLHLIGIYVARNKGCKTFDYVITHARASFKLAADIYIMKETSSVLGFKSGKVSFDKKKQALQPELASHIMNLVSYVGLEKILRCSPGFFKYKPTRDNKCVPGLPFQGNCGGAPAPPPSTNSPSFQGGGYGDAMYDEVDDVGDDTIGYSGRRRLNQVKQWKRECKTECAGERKKGKKSCKRKCFLRKRREEQLEDKTTAKDRREELCKAQCLEKGEPYPEFQCYPNCVLQFVPQVPSNPEVKPIDDPNWTPPTDPVWEDPNESMPNGGGNNGGYNPGNNGGYNPGNSGGYNPGNSGGNGSGRPSPPNSDKPSGSNDPDEGLSPAGNWNPGINLAPL